MSAIFERRSIRNFVKDYEISKDDVKDLIKAGMASPTAVNAKEWEFVIIDDKDKLNKVMEIHSASKMFETASLGILVCGNIDEERVKGYWLQDASGAIVNILNRAQEIGLGTCCCGIYPLDERVANFKNLFDLPDNIIPVSIIAVGKSNEEKPANDRYIDKKIHYNTFGSKY